jgi:hypothetical protein
MDGHEIFLALLEKHGLDRYPSVSEQVHKLVEELHELALEIDGSPVIPGRLRKELGDVGICMYGVAVKLGISLDECMTEVLRDETRTFG